MSQTGTKKIAIILDDLNIRGIFPGILEDAGFTPKALY